MDELNSQGRADPELWTGPLTRPRTLQGLIDSAQPYLKPLPTVAKPLRDEARTIVSATGGMKEALGKPRVDLVPSELILGAARALTFGVEKYDAHNWRKGIKGSLLYAALQRHLLAWNDGENNADDSGLNHLDHAAACLGMLMTGAGPDDRYDIGRK